MEKRAEARIQERRRGTPAGHRSGAIEQDVIVLRTDIDNLENRHRQQENSYGRCQKEEMFFFDNLS